MDLESFIFGMIGGMVLAIIIILATKPGSDK